jgi:ABC-2 type transport system permease protein
VKTLTMVGYAFTRLFRYRANLFFLFLFPLLLILVLGAAFGGSYEPRVGVVAARSGALGADLVRSLGRQEGIRVSASGDQTSLLGAIEHGTLQAGVIVPPGYDAALRAGRHVDVRFIARADGMQLRTTVGSAVAAQAAVVQAARFAQERGALPFDRGLAVARQAAAEGPGIGVTVRTVGTALFPPTLGRFDAGAPGELILFVFLMSMMGAIGLIEARRLGVIRRMLSTPTAPGSIVVGEGTSRFAVALLQALVIMLGSALLFGVHWGDPLAAAALVVAFALVGAGIGMLLGSVLRTEQQAVAISLLLGLGLGALGGCMVPSELFSSTMRTVAHVTPHAWALDGFTELARHGGHLPDVARDLGVLLGFAAVLISLASWRLRKAITRGA